MMRSSYFVSVMALLALAAGCETATSNAGDTASGGADDGGAVDTGASVDANGVRDGSTMDAEVGDTGVLGGDSGAPDIGVLTDAAESVDAGAVVDGAFVRDSAVMDAGSADAGVTMTGGELCGATGVGRIEGDVTLSADCVFMGAGLRVAGTLTAEPGSVIEIPSGESGLILETGGSLEGVQVDSRGLFAVAISEATGAALTDVTINVERGMGLYVTTSTAVDLSSTTIIGPVTGGTISDSRWNAVQGAPADPRMPSECVGCTCTPGESDDLGGRVCSAEGEWVTWTAVIGLYVRASEVSFDAMEVFGFPAYGAVLTDSVVTGNALSVGGGLGVGVRLEGTEMAVGSSNLSARYNTNPAVALFLMADSSFTATSGLQVETADYGVVANGGAIDLGVLDASSSSVAALWSNGTTARIGRGSLLNGCGATIVDAPSVSIGETGGFIVNSLGRELPGYSYGLLIINPGSSSTIANASLTGLTSAGLLIGVESAGSPVPMLSSVSVAHAGGRGYGALIGIIDRGASQVEFTSEAALSVAASGWDVGIERNPSAISVDSSPPGSLPFAPVPPDLGGIGTPASIIGPSYIVGPMF